MITGCANAYSRHVPDRSAGQEAEVTMGIGALGRHRRTHAQQMPTAEDALKHLLLTVDVERLYRLGLEPITSIYSKSLRAFQQLTLSLICGFFEGGHQYNSDSFVE